MQMLRDWLEGDKNYLDGVRLYLRFGSDARLKTLFTKEQATDFKRKKLEEAIRGMLSNKPVTALPVAPSAPIVESKPHPEKTWTLESCKDDVERAMREAWLKVYKTMQDKRSQLMLFPTDEERGVAAHQVLDLDEEADKILAMRDHYRNFGFLPSDQSSSIISDPVLAAKRIVLIERYIRRERQALRENKDNVRAAARLKKYVHEYNLYAERFAKNRLSEQAPEPGGEAEG